ncbi:phage holin family protein [Mangrovibacter plantisponsor]|uniref:Putative phage holin n=1 Tax=Mangrovibacter plantisponsor TaxID=451513 RepID=A0A317PH99_9ENTR|nr:phage holin family protein [Mangrovibacter plantisponsor]PWV99562.1 putative phage holin [Mangrovibacter plantisponsor]
MSDPVSGAGAILGSGMLGATFYGFVTHTDYGVVFGAFAGAVFYVATAANITRWRLMGYFLTSFILGVLGAGLVGAKLADLTGYTDRPLDAIGAAAVSALIIKVLTFVNNQDLNRLLGMLPRFRGGGPNDNK